MRLGCVILAAGCSRRFGRNKLLQDFCGKPLCCWILEAVPADLFEQIVVVTAYEEVQALVHNQTVVWNARPEQGISGSIRLGLGAAGDWDGAVFLTADQPLLTAKTLRNLARAFEAAPNAICAVAHDGKRGSPVLFPRCFFQELLNLQGDQGGGQVIRAHPEALHLVETPFQELLDCDTPENMEEILDFYAKNL